ncbi:hypothetical protein [Geothrix edaphica]|uniref:Uncharacterized protein n=1 Tax=Geothrix edaphica TaxID=2927976 RepID=A0ABQ5PZR2_9BACT|nr:hypothetical protein [Geothrix edaphica]GLH67669.1 hypothetical protein GETHED_20330 [Geothrix edaphica]
MLTEAFALVLQLPPLAFNEAPPPRGFQAPRELTCRIGELGRPWSPPAPRPLWSTRVAMDPRGLRPQEPKHLVNPLADFLLLFVLAGWASSTGGTVDFRTWPERNPGLATPPVSPFSPATSWANPRL